MSLTQMATCPIALIDKKPAHYGSGHHCIAMPEGSTEARTLSMQWRHVAHH
jgi:hypothetical protein